MNSSEYECKIFSEFVRVASLNVDVGSIRSCVPPEPDIACILNGRAVGFELTAATNEKFHEDLQHDGIVGGWMPVSRRSDNAPANEAIAAFRRKMTKRYRFDGAMELVIHEGLANLKFTQPWVEDFFHVVRTHLRGTVFRRVWVVGCDGGPVLAVWPPTLHPE